MMAPEAVIAVAGGLDDGGLGTSFEKFLLLSKRLIKAMVSPALWIWGALS